MAQAEVTVTVKRTVIIDVPDDFDPYGKFAPQAWAALSKSGALVEREHEEVTNISADWRY